MFLHLAPLRSSRLALTATVVVFIGVTSQLAQADILTPSGAVTSGINAARLNSVTQTATLKNVLTILSDGIVDHLNETNNYNTWNSDNTGVVNDFVGMQYDSASRFDTITLELGKQYGDGGDWDSMPTVYILKNPLLLGPYVEPNVSPAWVPLVVRWKQRGMCSTLSSYQGPAAPFGLISHRSPPPIALVGDGQWVELMAMGFRPMESITLSP